MSVQFREGYRRVLLTTEYPAISGKQHLMGLRAHG
jgi:hypothetical protein